MKKTRQSNYALVSNSRWLAYAAASAASTLGGTQSAEAEIHYSGVINERFGRSPVNYEHSVLPLRHSARLSFIEDTYDWLFGIDGAAVSNRFCGYLSRGGLNYVSRLSEGVVVSNCSFLPSGGFRYGVLFNTSLFAGGQFYPNGIGFIGFRFNNGAGIQYGWARLEMRSFLPETLPLHRSDRSRFRLVDYAWGDPGDQIKTGQTTLADDQVEAVPDHGSLGLLAIGGAGLMAWRASRRR